MRHLLWLTCRTHVLHTEPLHWFLWRGPGGTEGVVSSVWCHQVSWRIRWTSWLCRNTEYFRKHHLNTSSQSLVNIWSHESWLRYYLWIEEPCKSSCLLYVFQWNFFTPLEAACLSLSHNYTKGLAISIQSRLFNLIKKSKIGLSKTKDLQ